MNDPKNLKKPLTQLLQAVEQRDQERSAADAKALIEDLETPSSMADPRGGDRRQVPVPFSGLFHAVQREVRSAERLIAAENWEGAAKVLKETIGFLPL